MRTSKPLIGRWAGAGGRVGLAAGAVVGILFGGGLGIGIGLAAGAVVGFAVGTLADRRLHHGR